MTDTTPKPPSLPKRKEFKLINPTRGGRRDAIAFAKEQPQRTFDLVALDFCETRKTKEGLEYERRTLVYERFAYRNGELESYLLSDPRLGLTAEREVIFDKPARKPDRRS